MKKFICMYIIIFMFIFCTCANSSLQQGDVSDTESSRSIIPTEVVNQSPILLPFRYSTVDELTKSIQNDFTGEFFEKQRYEHGNVEVLEIFEKYITNFKNGFMPLYVPYYQGKEMGFFCEEDYGGNISIFPSNLYRQPWILYSSNIVSFDIMYIDENIKAEANEKGAPWLIKQINPNGNGEDAKPYLNYISRIEKEIVLQDRTVKTLECKYDDNSITYIYFVYDDVLVLAFVESETISAEWFKEFSFKKISLVEPFMNSVGYDTVDNLIKGISNDFTEDVLKEFKNARGEESGKIFESFITDFKNDSVPLYIPYYKGKEVELRNEEGFNNITLLTAELYNKPWIWYYPNNKDTDIYFVSIMYIEKNLVADANEKGCQWLMEEINPNGKGEGVKPYPYHETIKEENINLQDRTVKALNCKFNDDPRNYYYFVFGDVLVKVVSGTESKVYEWFKEFSFEKMSLKEDLQLSEEIPSSSPSQGSSLEQ